MKELLNPAVLTAYYSILGILALYGCHRALLLALYYRTRHRNPPTPPDPGDWPTVTVQLPLYNELYVAERLIRAVVGLDYPRHKLEIQVLDDSTDETREIVARAVAEHRRAGVDIIHLHRRDRTGFKAGALAAGLARARGELVTVLDADFVPQPEYLKLLVPHFADPEIGMVQARWGHINRDYSLLTRIQAVLLDGHFRIEHAARHRSGRFFNFNGTAGIWRRRAIEEAGGWEHDTLTEDLDLSFRAQLAGWRFLFLPEIEVPAELPVEINAFKRQQFRWAKGSIQTGRKLLRRILAAPLPLKIKLEALIHLTNNFCYVLMVGVSLLVYPAMVVRRGSEAWALLLIDTPFFVCATVSVLAFYFASQLAAGRGRWRAFKSLVPVLGLGIGLAVSNSRAVLQGLRRDVGVFERTPKYRIEKTADRWKGKKYLVRGHLSMFLEGLLAAWFAYAFLRASLSGMWMSLPFLWLFLQGYVYVFLLSLHSVTAGWRPFRWLLRRPAPSPSPSRDLP